MKKLLSYWKLIISFIGIIIIFSLIIYMKKSNLNLEIEKPHEEMVYDYNYDLVRYSYGSRSLGEENFRCPNWADSAEFCDYTSYRFSEGGGMTAWDFVGEYKPFLEYPGYRSIDTSFISSVNHILTYIHLPEIILDSFTSRNPIYKIDDYCLDGPTVAFDNRLDFDTQDFRFHHGYLSILFNSCYDVNEKEYSCVDKVIFFCYP